MIKYESQYKELTFFVGGSPYKFRNGTFSTDSEEVASVLDNSPYAKRLEEVGEVEATEEPKQEPKKASSKRKPATKKAD